MITDIRKSINSTLYNRVSSPFFGTLIVSWLVWNWKIVYTTFFIDENKIEKNKIDYIVDNFGQSELLIWYPLLSTLILLTVIPFISNGAYWLSLNFEKWKLDSKNKIEKKQLLTIEQSIQLREQIMEMDKRFESILSDKNSEIEQLKLLLENYKKVDKPKGNNIIEPKEEKENIKIADKIIKNTELLKSLKTVLSYVQGGYSGLGSDGKITPEHLIFFESNKLIENTGKGMYKLTVKGLEVFKKISDEEFK